MLIFSPCAGAAGKPVSIIRLAGGGSSGALGGSRGGSFATGLDAAAEAAEEAAAAAALLEDPAVAELAAYGYPPTEAAAALEESGGHVHRALTALHARLVAAAGAGGAAAASAGEAGQPADELEEWREERTALEAIYGEDAAFPSERLTSIQLPVELTSAAATSAAGGHHELRLHLDILAPPPAALGSSNDGNSSGSGEAPYPARPPVVGIRAEGVPPAVLLTLTRQLAQQAAELAGHPMIYELASAAAEALEGCLLKPLPVARLLPPAGAGAVPSRDASNADLAEQAERGLRLEDIANTIIPAADRGGQRRQPRGAGAGIDVAAESRRLRQRQAELDGSAEHAAMRAVRSRLPAAAQRAELLQLCGSRRVVVVSGATGCGKSTQVGRYSEPMLPAGRAVCVWILRQADGGLDATALKHRFALQRDFCMLQGTAPQVLNGHAPVCERSGFMCLQAVDKLPTHSCLLLSLPVVQVPQFLLEEAIARGNGGACNIIVTQASVTGRAAHPHSCCNSCGARLLLKDRAEASAASWTTAAIHWALRNTTARPFRICAALRACSRGASRLSAWQAAWPPSGARAWAPPSATPFAWTASSRRAPDFCSAPQVGRILSGSA